MATVKLFGAFGDWAGWTERRIEAGTFGALKTALGQMEPRIGERLDHASTMVIFNETILPRSLRPDDQPVRADDEIAFGPPFSGG
ncbi:MoaD/ThiS family protein [Brevundimonas sp.]|jgi:molybdopterin synthase sulfur carrier subunit|uniref:MoaD/ThiS family protein n=1 Tax=Brevundimonas sp. TaxID=1871086 RepID=UPI0037C0145F